MTTIINAHIDESLFIALNEGCVEIKESAAQAICSLFIYGTDSMLENWIKPDILYNLIDILSCTCNTDLLIILSKAIQVLINRVPLFIHDLDDASIYDSVNSILSYDICDFSSTAFDYNVFHVFINLRNALKGI